MHPNPARATTVVCTIVSKNYLAMARTLMDSVAAVHPAWKRYVLLVDEVDGYFEPSQESFQVVSVADLALPDAHQFLFRYGLLEVNTAVKPWLLAWLFGQGATERVVYLDPDIRVYQPLDEVEQLLGAGAFMTLTPHLLDSLNDGRQPNDQNILQAGCYNLGFIALARHRELSRFLAWWQAKLEFDCRVDLSEGLFVDQKWMDLAPGMFADVAILRHPGYNVAYWNLAHRPCHVQNGQICVAGQPLVFFHFSGLDPLAPGDFSKHQNRYRLEHLGECRQLVESYCGAVLDNGWKACKDWPYAFGTLHDGTQIPASMRRYFRSHADIARRVGANPFLDSHDYLNDAWQGARQPLVTRLMRAIWESRPDFRKAFPDIRGTARADFASHFVEVGARQEGIPERYVAPVRDSLLAWRAARGIADAAEQSWLAPPPRQCDDADRAAGWITRAFARIVLAIVPKPGSPERRRLYYRLLRPLKFLAPESLRRQLKQRLFARLKQQPSEHRSPGMVEHSHTVEGSTGQRLPQPAVSAAPPESTVTPRLTLYVGPHADDSSRGPQRQRAAGINIVGYLSAKSGVGESARLCAQAAHASGLPFSLHNVALKMATEKLDERWLAHLADHNAHAVNVFHVNADQMPVVRESLGASFFADRHNIGVWHWELPKFPDRWLGAFDLVDEIWAPSQFIQDALAARSPRPVVKIPHAIGFQTQRQATRAAFGLPSDDVLFLMMYDVQSFQQRKNPEGAIEAFRRAFAGARDVTLVVKVNDSHGRSQEAGRLLGTLRGVANVRILNATMDRRTTYDLLSVCDCLVSLHRAEGFGLVLAEAMFLGKPAIATGWSGNMEFMRPDNSCLVEYRLVPLDRDVGPYERGQIWAEPDLDHAAELMKKIALESSWRQRVAAAGQATIVNEFSPQRIGALVRQRLDAIRHWQPATRRFAGAAA